MSFDKRKYIFTAVAAILAAATLYVIYSLVRYGSPMEKSQNEYLVEANRLHNDSLYEAAVEPYMKAGNFNGQQSLVNYNTAVNTIMKNYPQLGKVFNDQSATGWHSVASYYKCYYRRQLYAEEDPPAAVYGLPGKKRETGTDPGGPRA